MMKKPKPKIIKSNTEPELPRATVKEAVQKRKTSMDHSSIIPGIDVNDLKHSLDLLKYALDYSEAIVDTVRIPLIVLNKKLQVLTANRAFYDTFRLAPEETENKLIYKLNRSAWNIPKLKVLLEKILPANTRLDNYEVDIDLPHLGIRTMLLNARRTYRQVNDTEAILLAFEDITERKQLETQKDDFIGIASHELKTPLTSIKAYSQILGKYLEQNNDEKGLAYLTKVSHQIDALTQLMASFENVYKIQSGKIVLNKTKFLVDELIGNTIIDFQHTNASHKILYEGDSNMTIFADREKITQVLINLISNAIKYSPNGNAVIITCVRDVNHLTISVADNGFGIPKEEQGKVFNRFFRVKSNRKKDVAGLGLGLFISQQIIHYHKGKIWVDSEEGKGSIFSFSIPAGN